MEELFLWFEYLLDLLEEDDEEEDEIVDYVMPTNADHRKQRGRTAPNRALGADHKKHRRSDGKGNCIGDLCGVATEPRHRRRFIAWDDKNYFEMIIED